MDACEAYARRWAKNEDVEVDTLSEWVKPIANVPKQRIWRFIQSVNTRHKSIFCDPVVVRERSSLYENFVVVHADKRSNNCAFSCKYVSIWDLTRFLEVLHTPIYCRFSKVFHQASIISPHETAYVYLAMSSDELRKKLWILKNAKSYKNTILQASSHSIFDPLYYYSTRETESRLAILIIIWNLFIFKKDNLIRF